MNSVRAELFAVRRRRTTWVVGVLWVLMSLVFGIAIPLIVYGATGGHASGTVSDPEALVAGTLPAHVLATLTGLYPTYGSALMLVLGAVLFGSDFRSRTWGGVFGSQPDRRRVVLARFAAAAVAALVVVVVDEVVMVAASEVVAAGAGRSAALPSAGALLESLGFTLLASVVGLSIGAALATLLRGVAGAIAVGLVWFLAIENLLSGLAGAVAGVGTIRAFLPSGSAGSLASYFTGSTEALPGVAHLSGPVLSVAVMCLYALVAVVVTSTVMVRRDVS